MVRQVAEAIAGKGAVVQVNTDDNPRIAGRYGVRGIPAIFMIKEGKVASQITGAQKLEDIVKWFERYAGA